MTTHYPLSEFPDFTLQDEKDVEGNDIHHEDGIRLVVNISLDDGTTVPKNTKGDVLHGPYKSDTERGPVVVVAFQGMDRGVVVSSHKLSLDRDTDPEPTEIMLYTAEKQIGLLAGYGSRAVLYHVTTLNGNTICFAINPSEATAPIILLDGPHNPVSTPFEAGDAQCKPQIAAEMVAQYFDPVLDERDVIKEVKKLG